MASSTDTDSSPSTESSDSGSGDGWASPSAGWDSEDEEIVSEIREVWRMSTVSFSVAEDSNDSLDAEEVAQIKAKLRALREYVSDLQASYDELLSLFGQHESSAKDSPSVLEDKLAAALQRAKDYQDQCQVLQKELSALQSDKPVSHVDPEVPLGAVGRSLAHDLDTISKGLESGVNKVMRREGRDHIMSAFSSTHLISNQLAELNLSPPQDHTLSSALENGQQVDLSPGSQLLQDQPEVKTMEQLKLSSHPQEEGEEERANEDVIREWNLEGIDEHSVLGQLLEKECQVTVLETCVQSLEHQLQEAHHQQMTTARSLSDTQQELQEHHRAAADNVEHKEACLQKELSELRAERDRLATEVAESYHKVDELLAAKDTALDSMGELQDQLDEMRGDKAYHSPDLQTASSWLAVEGERPSELDQDRAVLEEHQQQLCQRCREAERTVHTLQGKLRRSEQETQDLQSEVARKNGELTRLLSSIQVAQAQIDTMHKRLQQPNPSPINSNKTSPEQLTAAERASEALENTVSSHMSLWEDLCDSVQTQQTSIALMQDRHTELEAEVHEREARVLELEALLQAEAVSSASGKRSLTDICTSVGLLKADLARTREEQLQASTQYAEHLRILGSGLRTLLAEQLTLQYEVTERERQLSLLQGEHQELTEQYSNTCVLAHKAEAAKQLAEERLSVATAELKERSNLVADLEAELLAQRRARELDLELTTISLYSLRDQLASAALMSGEGRKAAVQDQLSQRDALLQTLQEQTAELLAQYQQATEEVEERQRLVQSLEADLLSSEAHCDALQQEIAEGQQRSEKLEHDLRKSETECLQLSEQLQTLQKEAEDACHELERSLRQNQLITQRSQNQLDALELQLTAERGVAGQLVEQVQSLKQSSSEAEKELEHVRRLTGELEEENTRLYTSGSHQKELILRLQAQVTALEEERERKYTAIRRESQVLVEGLRQELADSEEGRRAMKRTALERLNSIMSLQAELEDAASARSELEMKVARLSHTHLLSEDHVHRQHVAELEEMIASLHALLEEKEEELQTAHQQSSTGTENTHFIQQKLDECREELRRCQQRATELDSRYQSSLVEVAEARSHLSHNALEKEETAHVLTHLKLQLEESQQQLRVKEGLLSATEEEHTELLHRFSNLERQAQLKEDLSQLHGKHESEVHASSKETGSSPPSLSGGATSTGATSSPGAHQCTGVSFPSSYQRTLEKGLSSGSMLDTSGYSSPTESSDGLDKAYWIRRTAELSIQLQQSSQYWTSKTRELELQLHKNQQ